MHDRADRTAICRAARDADRRRTRKLSGNDDGLVIGLQLTHSGRFCKPNDKHQARAADPLPPPDPRPQVRLSGRPSGRSATTTSRALIDDYIAAAKRARDCGFDFVDVKHCHGYLGHEFLGAHTRPGDYGGSFENRTRFLREIVAGIRAEVPGLEDRRAAERVRLRPLPARSRRRRRPASSGPASRKTSRHACPTATASASTQNDPIADRPDRDRSQFLELLRDLDIRLVNSRLGSPYYNPHMQRPALYPPSDGYQPPEDPLVGVHAAARGRAPAEAGVSRTSASSAPATRTCRSSCRTSRRPPCARLGRQRRPRADGAVLPRPAADMLAGERMQTKKICRTFSDCTTAPRNGLVSGCYPLDPHYKKSPEFKTLAGVKKASVRTA